MRKSKDERAIWYEPNDLVPNTMSKRPIFSICGVASLEPFVFWSCW
jgi:hypothetical protein